MKLSVIIPAYQVEKYISDCLSSVFESIHRANLENNAEVILVDDGSPDKCPAICDSYAAKDARIRVIHKKNGGLSSARNVGMRYARGKIISFVDSDDELLPDFYEKMLSCMQAEQADAVCCGMVMLHNGVLFSNCPAEPKIYLGDETVLVNLGKDGAQDFMMNKIYKRELLEGIEFPEGKAFEDVFVQHLIQSKSQKTVFLNSALYGYRYNNAGITHAKQYKPHMMDFVEACRRQYEFTKENYPAFLPVAMAKYLNSIRVIAWYQYRNNHTSSRRKTICDLAALVKRDRAQIQPNPYLSPLLQMELSLLGKGYGSWNRYCKKSEFVKKLHNHPRAQIFFARLFDIPLDLPRRDDQY